MKPITKVFLVIGALVLSLVIWGLFFNGGGVLETAWNALATPINNTWKSVTGGNTNILPQFKETGTASDTGSLDTDKNMGGN